MADASENAVAEVLGWKSFSDTKQVHIGFRHADGCQSALALPVEAVDEAISALVRAKGTLVPPKDTGIDREFAMKVDGVNFGTSIVGRGVFLRFSFVGGGQLGFSMDKRLAGNLARGLTARGGR